MPTIHDQIDELRREIRDCALTDAEHADAHAELARLVAEQAKLNAAFEADLAAYAPPD
jgi:hypothetical protein